MTDCKVKLLHVSPELLVQALHLPEGTTIEAVSDQIRFNQRAITFRISHPSFPPVEEGNVIPSANCLVTRRDDGSLASEYDVDRAEPFRREPRVLTNENWRIAGF